MAVGSSKQHAPKEQCCVPRLGRPWGSSRVPPGQDERQGCCLPGGPAVGGPGQDSHTQAAAVAATVHGTASVCCTDLDFQQQDFRALITWKGTVVFHAQVLYPPT